MKLVIEVENIKCGGCAHSIRKKISENDHLEAVEIDIEQGIVSVTLPSDDENKAAEQREQLVNSLKALGYPERGSVEGLAALKGKAKSYVSCAVGRISDSKET